MYLVWTGQSGEEKGGSHIAFVFQAAPWLEVRWNFLKLKVAGGRMWGFQQKEMGRALDFQKRESDS